MTNRDLITKLHALQGLRFGGDPRESWKKQTREALLARVISDIESAPTPVGARFAVSEWARLVFPHDFSRLVLKPAMLSMALLATALGGWVTTVSASYSSLPGDRLYGVKLAAERAQASLVMNDADRAKLRVEFMARRVDEVAKIAETPGADKAEKVQVAVKKIKEEATTVQAELEALKNSKPDSAADVAKLVDRKTGEMQSVLEQTVREIPEAVGEVQEARTLVTNTSVKAVAVLVETQNAGSVQITADAVKEKVEERINAAAATTPEAREALGVAKELFANNDLSGAISKVAEVATIERDSVQATSTPPASPLVGTAPTADASITLPLVGQITSSTLINSPLPATNVSSTPR